jgi:hypothetical protein
MHMRITATLLAAACGAASAHHGWSSFDESRPIYLEGTVKTVRWQNPHAELTLEAAVISALPADLGKRAFPQQSASSVTPDLLSRATLPAQKGGIWSIELAPLTRMEAWGQGKSLAVGDRVSMIGYTLRKGTQRLLRVEILYTPDGRALGLRSAPK